MGDNKNGEQALRAIEQASTGSAIKVRNQCVAHKKTGERCQKAPILGATVCRFHGGAARHVRAAAKARLENAADRMARQLLGMVEDGDTPPAVKLAAIKDALDRAGLSPRQALDVSVALAPWEQLVQGMQLKRGPRPGSTPPDDDPDVVDAELVHEGEGAGTGPACRGCGLDFSDWPEPTGGYPATCRTCRAAEPTPRPSPSEDARSAAEASRAGAVTRERSSTGRRPTRDHGEHGLLTAEEAASRAATGNPRVRRKRRA